MSETDRSLEDRVASLERSLGELQAQVQRLADRPGVPAARAAAPPETITAEEVRAEVEALSAGAGAAMSGLPSLVGRTCLVLCGAFLLRFLAESNLVSPGVGVGLGVAYAIAWIVLANVAATRGRPMSGAFHAGTFAVIAYPLAWEASSRFGLLSPVPAAALIALVTAVGLVVAWRRAFRIVAWITLIAALLTTAGLLFKMKAVLPFGLLLLLLVVASLALAWGRGWRAQRWLVAAVVDLVAALLLLEFFDPAPVPWVGAGPLVVVLLGLAAVYLGGFGLRLHAHGRFVTSFAVVQGVLAWGLGYEGAVHVGGHAAALPLGLGGLVAGALAFAGAARSLARHRESPLAFGFFATLGTLFAVEGARLLLPGTAWPVAWAAGALALAVAAWRTRRVVLQVQAALLGLAAGLASGVVAATLFAFVAPAAGAWPSCGAPGLGVLALVLATLVALHQATDVAAHRWAAVAARVVLVAVGVAALGGLAVCLLGGLVASAPGPEADAGRLAVVRTAVIGLAALALGLAFRLWDRPELRWLSYLALLAGGLKLLVEDLRLGHAGTTAVSLALYGVALILAPALARRRTADEQARAEKAAHAAD